MLAVNYRGSNGRGSAYQKAIFADWGNKEVKDLLGAVDEVVRQGIADPERLAVTGWSNGGYLTNCLISRTRRFKAASSGAGIAEVEMGKLAQQKGQSPAVKEFAAMMRTRGARPG